MAQLSLFGPDSHDPDPKPAHDLVQRLKVLITVKAAPNPSERYGETVCVAGVRAELENPGWIRLYPINFRELGPTASFRKYDIVSVDAVPARNDYRHESWRPRMNSLAVEAQLPPEQGWAKRRAWLDSYAGPTMCSLNRAARESKDSPSLALVRPRVVRDFQITEHPGWSREEQRKIDAYVGQLTLVGDEDRTPLQPPRYRASYRYLCEEDRCGGHRQGLLDWEFVALQRRLSALTDAQAHEQLERRFLHEMCGPNRDVAFYVGNQAKRNTVFSVLGVYCPPRS